MREIVEPAAGTQDGAVAPRLRTFSVSSALILGGVAFGAFASLGFLAMPGASPVLRAVAALAWAAVAGVAAGWLVTETDPGSADEAERPLW